VAAGFSQSANDSSPQATPVDCSDRRSGKAPMQCCAASSRTQRSSGTRGIRLRPSARRKLRTTPGSNPNQKHSPHLPLKSLGDAPPKIPSPRPEPEFEQMVRDRRGRALPLFDSRCLSDPRAHLLPLICCRSHATTSLAPATSYRSGFGARLRLTCRSSWDRSGQSTSLRSDKLSVAVSIMETGQH